MNRSEATKYSLVFRTSEMIDFLERQTGAQEQMIRAILGSWVGILRNYVLSLVERNTILLKNFQQGNGQMNLGHDLIPLEQTIEDFVEQMRGSDIDNLYTLRVIDALKNKFVELGGLKAFEPIGWFSPNSVGFRVRCWGDFLQPSSDDPVEIIYGEI